MSRFRSKTRAERPDPSRLVPPEGVPVVLRIAGVGVRLGAQTLDILITGFAAFAIIFVAVYLNAVTPQGLMAVATFTFFFIRVLYYPIFELVWNGQTLGKRMLKIKVVSHGGGTLTTHAIVLRNLMKEAEVFLPITLLLTLDGSSPISSLLGLGWVAMTLAIPLTNRHRRRLGDYLAGTHVVHLPYPILLKDLSVHAPTGAQTRRSFQFLPHQLDHYGAYELQTLEGVLRVEGQANLDRQATTVAAIVDRIRHKIGYADVIAPADHRAFLSDFYAAQRARLEQRQLFGDRRKDKFHATEEKTE